MVRSFTCEEALIACEEKNLLHWLPPNLRVYPLQIGLETHCPCPILNRRSAYLTTAIYIKHITNNTAPFSHHALIVEIDVFLLPADLGRYIVDSHAWLVQFWREFADDRTNEPMPGCYRYSFPLGIVLADGEPVVPHH